MSIAVLLKGANFHAIYFHSVVPSQCPPPRRPGSAYPPPALSLNHGGKCLQGIQYLTEEGTDNEEKSMPKP